MNSSEGSSVQSALGDERGIPTIARLGRAVDAILGEDADHHRRGRMRLRDLHDMASLRAFQSGMAGEDVEVLRTMMLLRHRLGSYPLASFMATGDYLV